MHVVLFFNVHGNLYVVIILKVVIILMNVQKHRKQNNNDRNGTELILKYFFCICGVSSHYAAL